ncbi:MAG: hypothetical protein WC514_02910 [Candidatus Paceibacterota bacterium]
MELNTVNCPVCKEEVKLNFFGGGYVAVCQTCHMVVYNSKNKPQAKCKEENCGGDIDDKIAIGIAGDGCGCCSPKTIFHPCVKCGRLYKRDGSPVESEDGKKVFARNERIVYI